jgi:hypothetical protein
MPANIEDLNDWKVEKWPSTPEGEERQAREMLEMYEILFAHPQVEAITNWSGSDDGWLHAPAGILRIDNSEKPAYKALKAKVENEWRTQALAHTDADGYVNMDGLENVEGFKGAYELSCADKTARFVLDGKNDAQELRLA